MKHMTVEELIAKLQKCNPKAEIIIFDIGDDEYTIISVLDYKSQVHIHIDDPV